MCIPEQVTLVPLGAGYFHVFFESAFCVIEYE